MENQLVDVLMLSNTVIPEQVIAMPKISCPPRHLRAVLGEPQMVEQLVEVPTVVSFSSQFVEQIIDIPVQGGAHDFVPEQVSTAFCLCKLLSQNRVQRRGGLPRFLPDQGSTTCRRDRGPGGGPRGFVQGHSSAASFRDGGPGRGPQGFVPGKSSTALISSASRQRS